jgi:hypothetical protein
MSDSHDFLSIHSTGPRIQATSADQTAFGLAPADQADFL